MVRHFIAVQGGVLDELCWVGESLPGSYPGVAVSAMCPCVGSL